MIPLRDTIPSSRLPLVTYALLALNVGAFFIEVGQGQAIETFIYRFGVVPSHWLVDSARDLMDWPQLAVTLITFQFLHGGLLHLASNMLYLWIFGDNVEDRLGYVKFLALYLGSGVAAAITQMLMTPASSVPMVGASGSVAGVLGAYFLLFPSARIITLVPLVFIMQTMEVPAFLFLGFWFLLQWFQGVSVMGQMADVGGVAFWAHIGGFITGMAGAVVLRSRHRW